MSCFKKNLRNELLYNDIQIKEFAGRVGLPYPTVLSYLGEKSRLPRVDVAVRIARELGVTVEYLVTGSDSPLRIPAEKEALFEEMGRLPRKVQEALLDLVRRFSEIL